MKKILNRFLLILITLINFSSLASTISCLKLNETLNKLQRGEITVEELNQLLRQVTPSPAENMSNLTTEYWDIFQQRLPRLENPENNPEAVIILEQLQDHLDDFLVQRVSVDADDYSLIEAERLYREELAIFLEQYNPIYQRIQESFNSASPMTSVQRRELLSDLYQTPRSRNIPEVIPNQISRSSNAMVSNNSEVFIIPEPRRQIGQSHIEGLNLSFQNSEEFNNLPLEVRRSFLNAINNGFVTNAQNQQGIKRLTGVIDTYEVKILGRHGDRRLVMCLDDVANIVVNGITRVLRNARIIQITNHQGIDRLSGAPCTR